MRGFTTLLLFGFFLVSYQGQVSADWVSDLTQNLNQMQEQIHKNVNAQLEKVNRNVEEAVKKANEAVANANGTSINGITLRDGASVIYNQANGLGSTSRKVWFGKDDDGNSYYKDVDVFDFVDKFYQIERTYNATTKKLEVKIFTRDPKNPNAELVPVSSCQD